MLVIVCPGQGSQSPGFLNPWLELPGFRDRLSWLSAVAGLDLVTHGTASDADTIKDTAVAQPLIVASGLLSLLALFEHPADGFRRVGAGAGHSVGEITAAAAAGVMSAEQAMVLVKERGRAMAQASAVRPTGMSAVLGGDPDEVGAVLERHGLTPANINGAGQTVAAGTMEQLAALSSDPPAKARVIPLQVAGAFHTEHMAPAVQTLAGYARAISTHDPRVPLVSNADGQVVHDSREVLRRLVAQVSNPVRWDLCMETLASMGVTGLIEIPPAGTLTGLAKRGLPGVETLALKTPDDLEAAHRMVREHGAPRTAMDPTWRLVISPAKGIVSFDHSGEGAVVEPGSVVAQVSTLRDRFEVTANHGGRVIEWLVEDGDPVSPGQPLLRLHPQGV
ncbi:acyltransferase domain-containing protein [Luteipulveratus sp. YIM 133132]|uniref:acyltransferase domain-containing protein n=1 Tax=Luteipulveratus flavus TaxID=3031728 RepID=UPI0023AFE375|nr:acyltransferase domain-containing protein [Luteipulveratus sp. YIM 133132]MDE9367518.1 acyltransferase domain-containing protein [Luteipulveratus sp. YIM 133132]